MSTVPPRTDAAIVEQVVNVYLNRSRWARCIADDVRQEAYLAVERAREWYSADKGAWHGYAYRAAWLALATFLVAEASPVTRKEKGAPNTARRISDLYAGADGPTPIPNWVASHPAFNSPDNVELTVASAEWDAVVRARVTVLCRGDYELTRVLLEETTPAEVAALRGIPVARIYNAAASARSRLANDSELRALMHAKDDVHSEE